MKSLLSLLLLFVLHTALFASATGDAAPALDNPEWLDGKKHELSALKGKKAAVLFMLNLDQKGLIAIAQLHRIFKACDDNEVALFAIINGQTASLKRFPGISQLPFPVAADPLRKNIPAFMRSYDTLPMAVIIDKKGILCWRGPINNTLPVLRNILSGKYDLQESIRIEKFSISLSAAIRKKEYPAALKLIRAEWERNPKELELVGMMLTLLQKHLKQEKEAFALIAEAHRKVPGNFNVYKLEHQLITRTGKHNLLPGLVERAIKDFQEKAPMNLLSLAKMINQNPSNLTSMQQICKVFHAGWRNGKFKSPEEKGFFAIEYSKVMHIYGRPDLAQQLAQTATKLFKPGSKNGIKAAGTGEYYSNILKIMPALAL